jgi:hypothetical protein
MSGHLRGGFYIAIFVLAFESTMLFNYLGRAPEIQGGGEAVAVADSLVQSGSFANPFIATAETGPSAHVPPVFALILAAVIKLSGSHTNTAGFVLLALAYGIHVAMLPRMSILFFDQAEFGLYASAFCIFLPLFDLSPAWDAVYTATALMIFCLVSWRMLQARCSIPKMMGLGLFGALLVLLNPASAFVFVPWIVFTAVRYRVRASMPAVFALAVLLGCSPWVYRNWLVFHAFVPVRDDLGIALFSSNNDCTKATLVENIRSGCHSETHPIGSPAEARLVRDLGEVNYNRLRAAAARRWIQANFTRFASLTMRRIVEFWFPSNHYSIWIVTVISIVGWIAAIRTRNVFAWFAGAVFALYPLMYYIVEANPRYRYPILWLTVLYAGYGVGKVRGFLAQKHSERSA